MNNGFEFMPLLVSVKLASVTTCVLFIAGILLALLINYSSGWVKVFIEILVSLPMALPPTVIGYYMLLILSPESGIGRFVRESIGVDLLFSFTGIVIASSVHSLPYMVQPLKSGLAGVNRSLIDAAYTLGKSRVSVLLNVLLPNIRIPLITAVIMTFVHAMGEFGVVLMIGGSIPGETRVASIALYEKVEMMEYREAGIYAMALVALNTALVALSYAIQNFRSNKNVRY